MCGCDGLVLWRRVHVPAADLDGRGRRLHRGRAGAARPPAPAEPVLHRPGDHQGDVLTFTFIYFKLDAPRCFTRFFSFEPPLS